MLDGIVGRKANRRALVSGLYDYQEGKCYICFKHLDRSRPASEWGFVSIDHVVPKSRYHEVAGEDVVKANFLLAHAHCNCEKADHMPTGCQRIHAMAAHAHAEKLAGFPLRY